MTAVPWMLNEHKPTAENSNCVSRGTALFVCVANVRLLESIEREREREREREWTDCPEKKHCRTTLRLSTATTTEGDEK